MQPGGVSTGLHFSMAAPRKKASKAPARTSTRGRSAPRFRLVEMEDGTVRAERVRSSSQVARDQALADFYGVAPQLSVTANMRSMESLLGEVLEGLHLDHEAVAPEILAGVWKRAVGDSLASCTELQSISRHTARVWVNHPIVRFELNRIKPKLIQALNAELGEDCVRSVKFVQ